MPIPFHTLHTVETIAALVGASLLIKGIEKCSEKYCANTEINEVETLKNTVNELKNQVALLVKENGKIHPKTLQRINNQLNNINNGNVIHNTYVKFGDVEYEKILNNKQIKRILDKQYQSLEESIKQIHFNKNLPEYSNIFITNMERTN